MSKPRSRQSIRKYKFASKLVWETVLPTSIVPGHKCCCLWCVSWKLPLQPTATPCIYSSLLSSVPRSNFVQKTEGNPVYPRMAFGIGASNVISSLVFRHRIDQESVSGSELMMNIRDLVISDSNALLTFFPFLWFVLKRTGKFKKAIRAWDNMHKFILEQIRVHQERIDASSGKHFYNCHLPSRWSSMNKIMIQKIIYRLLT